MYIYKTEEFELYKHKFIAYPANSKKNVVLNFYDVTSGTGIFTLRKWATVKRLNKKKQGNIILNDGVGVKQGNKLKEFHHIEKVDFKGSTVYETKVVEKEKRNVLEKIFNFDFFVKEEPLFIDEPEFFHKNPTGKFIED